MVKIALTASHKFILAASGTVGIGFVLLVALLGQSWANLPGLFPTSGAGSVAIVQAALSLQARIWGPRSNTYNANDPLMKRVIGYWKTYCSDGKGGLCLIAQSGNLQCVEFVTAAYWLAGDPLPAIENAQDFWSAYANRAGWERIPSPSSFRGSPFLAPQPGDLMVWKGGGFYQTGQWYEFGHIAIVVSYRPPSGGHNGTIEVAQANAPGNKYLNANTPGNTYTMSVHPNGRIDTWGATADAGGYTILGFLRHLTAPQLSGVLWNATAATSLPKGVTFATPYVQEAWNDALASGIPPGYFVRQINVESHFNPLAVSPTGAIGIAQFLPETARGLPNPLGSGTLNPWDPHQSLLAAARYMATKAGQYSGDYAKALAAYNAGDQVVQTAVQTANDAGTPSFWPLYLPEETRGYLNAILGN